VVVPELSVALPVALSLPPGGGWRVVLGGSGKVDALSAAPIVVLVNLNLKP
jgi:hypothetical protein